MNAATIATVPSLDRWIDAARAVVDRGSTTGATVAGVQAAVSRLLADHDAVAELVAELQAEARRRPARLLVQHVERESPLTVQVFRWPPGWTTSVHDHVSWGVVGVLLGAEHEHLYRVDHREDGGAHAVRRGGRIVIAGECTSFVPPHDVHQVRTPEATLSLHVYGADLSTTGGSTRRRYDEGP